MLEERERMLLSKPKVNRLYSFFFHKLDGIAVQDFQIFKRIFDGDISRRACDFRTTGKSFS